MRFPMRVRDAMKNKIGPSPDRWKIRSRTYVGIAKAMAEQWGGDTRVNVEAGRSTLHTG
jgi:hypothetical protein